jgi:hypothetical protein
VRTEESICRCGQVLEKSVRTVLNQCKVETESAGMTKTHARLIDCLNASRGASYLKTTQEEVKMMSGSRSSRLVVQNIDSPASGGTLVLRSRTRRWEEMDRTDGM